MIEKNRRVNNPSFFGNIKYYSYICNIIKTQNKKYNGKRPSGTVLHF